MNYEIVELENFSGSQATIYSVIMEDDGITLFDHFVNENITDYRKEIRFIANRLQEIGNTTGRGKNSLSIMKANLVMEFVLCMMTPIVN